MNFLTETIIPIALLVLIVIIWAGYAYGKRRAEAFHAFARRRGLSFSKLSTIDVEKSFNVFRLFSEGFEKKVSNLISGESNGAMVFIFDYSYKYIFRTGEGQSPQTQSQTVLILQSDNLNLPSFQLKADNKDEIKKVFTDQALSYLGTHTGLTIEGSGNKLIFYRSNTLPKPDDLNSFLDEGLELFRMMK